MTCISIYVTVSFQVVPPLEDATSACYPDILYLCFGLFGHLGVCSIALEWVGM